MARSEAEVQARINRALKESGGLFTSEINDLVAERSDIRSAPPAPTSSTFERGRGSIYDTYRPPSSPVVLPDPSPAPAPVFLPDFDVLGGFTQDEVDASNREAQLGAFFDDMVFDQQLGIPGGSIPGDDIVSTGTGQVNMDPLTGVIDPYGMDAIASTISQLEDSGLDSFADNDSVDVGDNLDALASELFALNRDDGFDLSGPAAAEARFGAPMGDSQTGPVLPEDRDSVLVLDYPEPAPIRAGRGYDTSFGGDFSSYAVTPEQSAYSTSVSEGDEDPYDPRGILPISEQVRRAIPITTQAMTDAPIFDPFSIGAEGTREGVLESGPASKELAASSNLSADFPTGPFVDSELTGLEQFEEDLYNDETSDVVPDFLVNKTEKELEEIRRSAEAFREGGTEGLLDYRMDMSSVKPAEVSPEAYDRASSDISALDLLAQEPDTTGDTFLDFDIRDPEEAIGLFPDADEADLDQGSLINQSTQDAINEAVAGIVTGTQIEDTDTVVGYNSDGDPIKTGVADSVLSNFGVSAGFAEDFMGSGLGQLLIGSFIPFGGALLKWAQGADTEKRQEMASVLASGGGIPVYDSNGNLLGVQKNNGEYLGYSSNEGGYVYDESGSLIKSDIVIPKKPVLGSGGSDRDSGEEEAEEDFTAPDMRFKPIDRSPPITKDPIIGPPVTPPYLPSPRSDGLIIRTPRFNSGGVVTPNIDMFMRSMRG